MPWLYKIPAFLPYFRISSDLSLVSIFDPYRVDRTPADILETFDPDGSGLVENIKTRLANREIEGKRLNIADELRRTGRRLKRGRKSVIKAKYLLFLIFSSAI